MKNLLSIEQLHSNAVRKRRNLTDDISNILHTKIDNSTNTSKITSLVESSTVAAERIIKNYPISSVLSSIAFGLSLNLLAPLAVKKAALNHNTFNNLSEKASKWMRTGAEYLLFNLTNIAINNVSHYMEEINKNSDNFNHNQP